MASLRERVLRTIKREDLVPRGGRVFVALSGGSDSTALTLLLHELASASTFSLEGVLHFNHQLRDSAGADERFCRDLCETLSVPLTVERADVGAKARRDGISIEEAGHRERYAFFARMTGDRDTYRVATGHTRDDQAETYLLRVLRGAGPSGLSAIRPRSGLVVRPLLDASRYELRAFLEGRGQAFCEDETNQDLRVPRNRVRHRLIPFIEEHFSPSIIDVLAREAAIARADADWLEGAADTVTPTIVATGDGWALVNTAAISGQPLAVARRIAKRALEHVAGRSIGFEPVDRLLGLAAGPAQDGGVADLPGCRVERRGPELHVVRPALRDAGVRPSTAFEYQLSVPGEVDVREAGLTVSATCASVASNVSVLAARGTTVAVAARDLSDPLIVRSWRPGDVIRPLGLGGRKKLQDLFVDRKVTRTDRQTVPIVADSKMGIVWVVGHTVAEEFRVGSETPSVLILTVRKLGGFG